MKETMVEALPYIFAACIVIVLLTGSYIYAAIQANQSLPWLGRFGKYIKR